MTNGTSIGAVNGGAANTPRGDDAFSSLLGDAMHGNATSNDMAKVASTTVQGGSQATPANASGTAQADSAARGTQSLHPLQETTPDTKDAVQDPTGFLAALTSDPNQKLGSPSGATTDSDAPADPTKAVASDPAQGVGGDAATAKPANAVSDALACDPMLAQLLATQQTTPPQPTAPPPTDSTVPSDPAQLAAEALAAPAADADAAATPIPTGGTSPKSAKDDKAPADGDKSQAQGSTAAALADIGAAAARSFTDTRVSTAHALPLHAASAPQQNNNQSGGSPTDQQGSPNSTATAPAPVADAAAANATFTPAHAPVTAQPDAASAINAVAAPPASVAASAPAQAASQLQVSHPATALPDINSLAFNIAAKSEGGARHFDIRLDPAELGRVDVRLTVDDAGKAQATLSVEKPQTLALLQKDSGHLERALKDAGLDLSQNGLNFSLKGQQQQNSGGGGASSSRGRNLAVRAIVAADTAASNLSLGSVSASDTRLDIRV